MSERPLIVTRQTKARTTCQRVVLTIVVVGAGAASACTSVTQTRQALGDRGMVVRSVSVAGEQPWHDHASAASLAEASRAK